MNVTYHGSCSTTEGITLSIPDGTWTCVAIVESGATVTAYVNGRRSKVMANNERRNKVIEWLKAAILRLLARKVGK